MLFLGQVTFNHTCMGGLLHRLIAYTHIVAWPKKQLVKLQQVPHCAVHKTSAHLCSENDITWLLFNHLYLLYLTLKLSPCCVKVCLSGSTDTNVSPKVTEVIWLRFSKLRFINDYVLNVTQGNSWKNWCQFVLIHFTRLWSCNQPSLGILVPEWKRMGAFKRAMREV